MISSKEISLYVLRTYSSRFLKVLISLRVRKWHKFSFKNRFGISPLGNNKIFKFHALRIPHIHADHSKLTITINGNFRVFEFWKLHLEPVFVVSVTYPFCCTLNIANRFLTRYLLELIIKKSYFILEFILLLFCQPKNSTTDNNSNQNYRYDYKSKWRGFSCIRINLIYWLFHKIFVCFKKFLLPLQNMVRADLFPGSLAVWASHSEATISSFSLAAILQKANRVISEKLPDEGIDFSICQDVRFTTRILSFA